MPRPRPTVTVRPTVEVKARAKRPPLGYVKLLTEAEDVFRAHAEELEQSDLFRELCRRGVIRRGRAGGKMPRARYEEYMDQRLQHVVERYGLESRPQWRHDFTAPHALRDAAILARQYGIPEGELAPLLRYLTSGRRSAHRADGQAGAEAPDVADYAPAASALDLSEPMEIVRDFVLRHNLSEEQLVRDFLHGEEDTPTLARRYGADQVEVAAVLEAVQSVLIADVAAGPPRAPTPPPATGHHPVPPVAAIVLDRDSGELSLHFRPEAGYGLHYIIDPSRLDETLTQPGAREEVDALLDQIKWINQRRSLVARMVSYIFRLQHDYFATGDELQLRPLSQADLARALGEHQSSVCRAIRGKFIQTPQGVYELQQFCQSKGQVVRRLAAAYPQLSARELQRLLREKYGCAIARRTVAYHRTAGSSTRRANATTEEAL